MTHAERSENAEGCGFGAFRLRYCTQVVLAVLWKIVGGLQANLASPLTLLQSDCLLQGEVESRFRRDFHPLTFGGDFRSSAEPGSGRRADRCAFTAAGRSANQ